MKNQEEKEVRLSGKRSVPNPGDTTDAGKTQNPAMNKKVDQGKFQNFKEKNDFYQHRKTLLDHLEQPNHGDA